MPQFPRYQSQAKLDTGQTQFLAPDKSAKADMYGDLAKVGGAIADTGLQWMKAVDTIQSTVSASNRKIAIADVMARAELETDPNKAQSYIDELKQASLKSLEGITYPGTKSRAMQDANLETELATIQLNGLFKKKQVEIGQVSGLRLIDAEVNDVTTPLGERMSNIEGIVASQVEGGLWGEKEGYNLVKQSVAKAKENSYLHDIQTNPALAEKRLSSGYYGFDVEGMNNARKVFEQQLNVIQNQTAEEFMQMKLDGTLQDEETIRQAVSMKKLDPTVGISMIKDLNTVVQPKATILDKTTEYNKLVAMRESLKDKEKAWLGLGNADFEQRANYRAAVFDAHRKGLITDDEMEKDFLMQEVTNKFMNDPTFRNAMKEIYAMSEQYQSKEDKDIAKAEMSKAIIRKVMDGKTPKDALDETIIEKVALDFPGVNPVDLVYTAKKRGAKVWQIYKILKPNGRSDGSSS